MEILTAMAVLLLLMVAVLAMMSNVQRITVGSNKRLDAESEAHLVFDRLAGDFARMPKRADIDYLLNHTQGNDSLYFYSAAPGFSTAAVAQQNSVALVGYRINAKFQLERLGKGLSWDGGSADGMVFLTYSSYPVTASSSPVSGSTLSTAFPDVVKTGSTDANYHLLAEDVFRFELCFLLKGYTDASGSTQPAVYSNFWYDKRQATHVNSAGTGPSNGLGLADVQAVVVSVAVLDSISHQTVPASTDLSTAAAALPDPADTDLAANPAVLPVTAWQGLIDQGTFQQNAGLPTGTANQVRVYQHIFPLE